MILLSSVAGYFFGVYQQQSRYSKFLKSFRNIREGSGTHIFINPLIGNVSAPATDVGLYVDIKDEVSSYLKTQKFKGDLYDYSYYFRDMNTGLWYGENDATSFFPASLFKLPIAIATYKQIEKNPSLQTKLAVYTQEISDINTSASLNSESLLVVGKKYSVEELVSMMILESDNGAKNLLLSIIDVSYLNKIFEIISSVDHKDIKAYEISSRKYALFLRMLYGSSYLNEDHSELLLNMLSRSDFKDGLVAGVPSNIPVAHKYGVYEVDEIINGKLRRTQQLHDCGIIYHFKDPYIFCFMTKGKDNKSLLEIISHVSKLVYDNQNNK
jgi:beta-lactamase class A